MSSTPRDVLNDPAVERAELAEIRRHRERLGRDTVGLEPGADAAARRLSGLAFSGGGVRAACIALGVTQALARSGLFAGFDYLSTVSGGGYFGGALSSLLGTGDTSDQGALDRGFPFRLGVAGPEPAPLLHLRSFADFLAPEGGVGRLRLAAILVRGVVLNVLLFLPWILAVVVLTEISYEIESRFGLQNVTRAAALGIFVAGLLLVYTFPFVVRLGRRRFTWKGRNGYELIFAAALAVILVTLAVLPFERLTHFLVLTTWPDVKRALVVDAHVIDSVPFWAAVIAVGIIWFGLRARVAAIARVTALIGAGVLWLLGPVLVIGAYLFLCLWFVHLPFVNVPDPGHALTAIADPAGRSRAIPGAVRAAVNHQLEAEDDTLASTAWLGHDGGTPVIHAPYTRDRTGVLCIIAPTNGPGGSCTEGRFPIRFNADSTLLTVTLRQYPEPRDIVVLALLVLVVLLNGRIVDVNVTSLHQFYRDRLSRAYLLRRDGGDLAANDTQLLSALNPSGLAPYHLINATINVSGSSNPLVRGRNADFFLFSRSFVGSVCTGYCPTTLVERADPRLDLASAIAISGAAAGPRMGVDTVDSLVGDMTLFNLRLGYWLANPERVMSGTRGYAWRGPGPGYLLREAFGSLNERGRYVNVSDGGHIENLGVYELLRRRCALVVAVDAESDPDLACDAMATLIRYARIDLGVEIEIDLTPLRLCGTGSSAAHAAVGTIHYDRSAGERGMLVYLKSSLTGDENEYIKAFARQHPDFPQQSTADQFFTEVDFEVYRALGDHIAAMAVSDGGAIGAALRGLADAAAVRA